jgi:hypothetical protein
MTYFFLALVCAAVLTLIREFRRRPDEERREEYELALFEERANRGEWK